MSHVDLRAGSMTLKKVHGSDTYDLTVRYNAATKTSVEIRGEDELYALQYLVNRAVMKMEGK